MWKRVNAAAVGEKKPSRQPTVTNYRPCSSSFRLLKELRVSAFKHFQEPPGVRGASTQRPLLAPSADCVSLSAVGPLKLTFLPLNMQFSRSRD